MKNYGEAFREWERNYIEQAVREHGGSITKAAKAAGIYRTHFYKMIDRSGAQVSVRDQGGNAAWQELSAHG